MVVVMLLLLLQVVQQLADAMQPALTDVVVDWGLPGLDPAGDGANAAGPCAGAGAPTTSLLGWFPDQPPPVPSAQPALVPRQAPATPPPIFAQSRFSIYCELPKGSPLPQTVTITASTPEGPLELQLPVPVEAVRGRVAHRLYARALVRDLEEGTSFLHPPHGPAPPAAEVHDTIVAVSTKWGVLSSRTAFVAVEQGPQQSRPVAVCVPRPKQDAGKLKWNLLYSAPPSDGASELKQNLNAVDQQLHERLTGIKQISTPIRSEALELEALELKSCALSAPSTAFSRSARSRCSGFFGLSSLLGLSSQSKCRPRQATAASKAQSPGWWRGWFGAGPARPEMAASPPPVPNAFDSVSSTQQSGAHGAQREAGLQTILATQAFDGLFTDLQVVVAVARLQESEVQAKLAVLVQDVKPMHRAHVMATAIALAVLSRDYSAVHSEWQLIAAKAEKALLRIAAPVGSLQTAVAELLGH